MARTPAEQLLAGSDSPGTGSTQAPYWYVPPFGGAVIAMEASLEAAAKRARTVCVPSTASDGEILASGDR